MTSTGVEKDQGEDLMVQRDRVTQATRTFSGGTKTFIVRPPDHPAAEQDSRHNESCWTLIVADYRLTELGARLARANATPNMLWSEASSVLHDTVSSSEVDRQELELKEWIKQIHDEYHARQEPPPIVA